MIFSLLFLLFITRDISVFVCPLRTLTLINLFKVWQSLLMRSGFVANACSCASFIICWPKICWEVGFVSFALLLYKISTYRKKVTGVLSCAFSQVVLFRLLVGWCPLSANSSIFRMRSTYGSCK